MRNVKRTIRIPAGDVISDLAPPPQWIEPELCKLVTRIPAGDNWAHEIKFDGFRTHTRIVKSRAAHSASHALPPEFGFLAVDSAMLQYGPSNAWQWASSCKS